MFEFVFFFFSWLYKFSKIVWYEVLNGQNVDQSEYHTNAYHANVTVLLKCYVNTCYVYCTFLYMKSDVNQHIDVFYPH